MCTSYAILNTYLDHKRAISYVGISIQLPIFAGFSATSWPLLVVVATPHPCNDTQQKTGNMLNNSWSFEK